MLQWHYFPLQKNAETFVVTGDSAKRSMSIVGNKLHLGQSTAAFSSKILMLERYFHQCAIPAKAERRGSPFDLEAPATLARHEAFRQSIHKQSTSKVCILLGTTNVKAYIQQHRHHYETVTFFSISADRIFKFTPFHGAIEWEPREAGAPPVTFKNEGAQVLDDLLPPKPVAKIVLFSFHPDAALYCQRHYTAVLMDTIWNSAASMTDLHWDVNETYFQWKIHHAVPRKTNLCTDPHTSAEDWQALFQTMIRRVVRIKECAVYMRIWEHAFQLIPLSDSPQFLLDHIETRGLTIDESISVPAQVVHDYAKISTKTRRKGQVPREVVYAILKRLREEDKLSWPKIAVCFEAETGEAIRHNTLRVRYTLGPDTPPPPKLSHREYADGPNGPRRPTLSEMDVLTIIIRLREEENLSWPKVSARLEDETGEHIHYETASIRYRDRGRYVKPNAEQATQDLRAHTAASSSGRKIKQDAEDLLVRIKNSNKYLSWPKITALFNAETGQNVRFEALKCRYRALEKKQIIGSSPKERKERKQYARDLLIRLKESDEALTWAQITARFNAETGQNVNWKALQARYFSYKKESSQSSSNKQDDEEMTGDGQGDEEMTSDA